MGDGTRGFWDHKRYEQEEAEHCKYWMYLGVFWRRSWGPVSVSGFQRVSVAVQRFISVLLHYGFLSSRGVDAGCHIPDVAGCPDCVELSLRRTTSVVVGRPASFPASVDRVASIKRMPDGTAA